MASITDKPIAKLEQDSLNIQKYSNSLSKFIKNSDTPITIGLQGEWGTGIILVSKEKLLPLG